MQTEYLRMHIEKKNQDNITLGLNINYIKIQKMRQSQPTKILVKTESLEICRYI